MTHFYEPDLTANPDSPFVRDASNKLVRPDATLVMVMTKEIGANLTNDEKSTSNRSKTRMPDRSSMRSGDFATV
jgi:hypothetical protein